MRAWSTLILVLWGALAACNSPSEAECRAACENVVRVSAGRVQGLSEAERGELVERAGETLEPCMRSCMSADASEMECLAEASSLKEIDECVRY